MTGRKNLLGRCYMRNGVWGWPMEEQETRLRAVGVFDAEQLYRDELSVSRARKPSHIQPAWLLERADLLKPTRRRSGETIYVATLLALAVSEGDLVTALVAASGRQATIKALDSGLEFALTEGPIVFQRAVADWQRAKRDAQTKPGRAEGNRVAAEKRRRRTLEKLPEARPLWRDAKPTRLTVEQISEQVGLSGKTLYAELGRRPDIRKGRKK